MSSPNGLVLWVLGGAGVILMYSAFKGQNPLRTVQTSIDNSQTSVAPNSQDTVNKSVVGTESFGSTVYTPSAYTVGTDSTGTEYVYNSDGVPISTVPAAYSSSPHSYIPA